MLVWGFIVSLLGAVVAYYKQALTGSGTLAAIIVGTLIAGWGGWIWFTVLAAFFVSSSAWSFYRREAKGAIARDFAKTGRRDFMQVMVNGGPSAVLAVLGASSTLLPGAFLFFMGMMATANADTWATELGVFSQGKTRSIRSGCIVPAGTSGGISLLGTAAGAGGALFIGLVAEGVQVFLKNPGLPIGSLLLLGLLGGVTGCLIDSWLGATVQSRYRCGVCGKLTEKLRHCQRTTIRAGGWRWMGNDLVNLLSSLGGGSIAWVTAWCFSLF